MVNNGCKYKGNGKNVKRKASKTVENVDKMESMLIS
jgi:hypothetical protein